MYLHNILNRDKGELVRRIYETQKQNPTKGDFIELVKEDMLKIGETFDEYYISCERRDLFKAKIQKKIRSLAFRELTLKQMEHSKVREIKYPEFKIQSYMTSCLFTNSMVSTLFNMRSSMTRNIKNNFSSMFQNDMKCKLKCLPEAIDSQSHLLRCPKVLEELEPAELESVKVVQYSDMFGSLEQQRKVVLSLMRIMEIRTKLLEKESLPVGDHTGP
jgi:hypothetical protein